MTITNPIGTSGPVQITALATTGASFAIDSGPTTPHSLNPGESVMVGVDFSPTSAGPAAGSLNVTHDEAGSPLAVALNGEGADASTVLFRVNAGGPELAALDGGPVWSADTNALPSPYPQLR